MVPMVYTGGTQDLRSSGCVEQPAPGPEAPEGLQEARMAATAAAYREQALADGIPDRPRGLFPPGDPVLGAPQGPTAAPHAPR